MVTKDCPTEYCRIIRQCIAEYYSMGRTRFIVLKVLVDCSWHQSRNTRKYENVVPAVIGNLGLENIASSGARWLRPLASLHLFPSRQHPGPDNKDIYIPSSSLCVAVKLAD